MFYSAWFATLFWLLSCYFYVYLQGGNRYCRYHVYLLRGRCLFPHLSFTEAPPVSIAVGEGWWPVGRWINWLDGFSWCLGQMVETSFVHEVFVETWMQLLFWVGHLFWWNMTKTRVLYIIYVDYLFIKRMGYPASYPTKHSKCWSMIFWKHSHWWKRQAGPISQAWNGTVGRHYNS